MNATNQTLPNFSGNRCFYGHAIIHDEYVVSDYFFKVLATVLNLLTCPFVVLLNALVIIAVKTKPRLQSKHNILLACLAVTDLLVGIGAQPPFIVQEISVLVSGSPSLACSIDDVVQLTILTLCLVSVLHLALISIERFVAIKYSLRYESIVTTFRLTVAVGCCWLVITMFFVVKILKLIAFPPFIFVFVSFAVIIFCHTYVYFVCRRHSIKIKSEQVSQEATAKFLKERKAWKTTSIILGGVFMCYLPMFVITIISVIIPGYLNQRLVVSSRPLFFTFFILNSLCNPIIYCWRSKEIREAAMQLLRRPANGGLN